jgi:DNA-binding IclR family transcriptional regulator
MTMGKSNPLLREEASGKSTERQSIQVIARAAAILRALEKNRRDLSLGEIAKLVALPRSTVQRIVDALDRENLLIASSAASGVRLGPALLALAAATHFEIADLARPTLEALAKETGESVDLAVADHDKVVFVDQVAGTHRLTAASAIGVSFPLHCSANGKAVLASLDGADLARLRKSMKLIRQTPNTIVTWAELEKELQVIRQTGVAFDREENSLGICAVATAIASPTGDLAAISVPVPTQRFLANEAALASQLLAHCDALRQTLGRWRPVA